MNTIPQPNGVHLCSGGAEIGVAGVADVVEGSCDKGKFATVSF